MFSRKLELIKPARPGSEELRWSDLGIERGVLRCNNTLRGKPFAPENLD